MVCKPATSLAWDLIDWKTCRSATSTGQRKRAAFARLLGQGAANWLLDEPLNGLDDDGVQVVEQLIAEHRAKGGLVVVASHQPIALDDRQIIDLRDHPA